MTHLQIGNIINNYNNFAIVSHTSPDGDSMGSMLALYNMLKQNNKCTDMLIDDLIPERYTFLPSSEKIKPFSEGKHYECLFALDCGDPERLGKCKNLLGKTDIVINIDHHISNYNYGKLNLIETNASSCGEILFDIFKTNNYIINKDIAMCLYTSILTDTGGFKYSNTTPKTLNITGELIGTGIDFSKIYSTIYDRKSIEQIRLMSKVVSTLELALDNRIAFLTLFQDMLKESDAKEEDASEFINISRDIEGVEVAVFIKEKTKCSFRVSLRSKSYVDVRLIAEKFGGGGHVRAAGCTIEGDYESVKSILTAEIKIHME